jgi:hypothetical protein
MAHPKTLRVFHHLRAARQRPGLRQPSAAFLKTWPTSAFQNGKSTTPIYLAAFQKFADAKGAQINKVPPPTAPEQLEHSKTLAR